MSSVDVTLQSASGRTETVRVEERTSDGLTCSAALRRHLEATNDKLNNAGWRVLSLGTCWR